MNFANNLRELRKDRNLSQEQLAEKLKISRQAISKWESGRSHPDIENLILLRMLFDINLDDLIMNDNIIGCKGTNKVNVPLKNIYLKPTYSKEDKANEENDLSTNLMLGGLMIGTAIGLMTENPMFGAAGSFLGVGIGYALEAIKK